MPLHPSLSRRSLALTSLRLSSLAVTNLQRDLHPEARNGSSMSK